MNELDFDEYQREAYSLVSDEGKKDLILNGVMGIAGEAGECIDLVKKERFQGHELDRARLKEELGDVLWYIAETASGLGISLREVASSNLDKLHERYHGDHFNREDSVNRKD